MNTEQESKRRDKAKVLYDNYKKTNKKVFTGNRNGGENLLDGSSFKTVS